MWVIRGQAGYVEECGNTISNRSLSQLVFEGFDVVFRTSEDNITGEGFQMYSVCSKPEEALQPGSFPSSCVSMSITLRSVHAYNFQVVLRFQNSIVIRLHHSTRDVPVKVHNYVTHQGENLKGRHAVRMRSADATRTHLRRAAI